MRMRRRAAVLFASVWFGVTLAALPMGAAAPKFPPSDRAYSLVGSAWTFGVFSTGVLQEPDFRVPYTRGNTAVVVRPVVRGDAAWFDPGFIVRDALANPSEDPKQSAQENKEEQEAAIATFRHPFLGRCGYPDPPNDNVAYPNRFFQRPDASFFNPLKTAGNTPTQQSSGAVLGAVAYGEAHCRDDYSIKLRAVNDEFVAGAESAPTLQAASMKSFTNVFFDGDDKTIGVSQSTSMAEGVNFMNGLLTIEKLSVTAEARATGERSGAKAVSAMRIVGARVAGQPVEIRRDGVFVANAGAQTEEQRKAAQNAVNAALASQKIKVVALGVKESIDNSGEDVVIVGGGIQIEWELPKATLPEPVLAVLRGAGITPPQTTVDTMAIQIGHVDMLAHAVKIDALVLPDVPLPAPAPAPVTRVLGEKLAVPVPVSSYQAPQVEAAVSLPVATNPGIAPAARNTPLRPLVKLPAWALLLLATGAGTVVSATYLLTQQRLPIPTDLG